MARSALHFAPCVELDVLIGVDGAQRSNTHILPDLAGRLFGHHKGNWVAAAEVSAYKAPAAAGEALGTYHRNMLRFP